MSGVMLLQMCHLLPGVGLPLLEMCQLSVMTRTGVELPVLQTCHLSVMKCTGVKLPVLEMCTCTGVELPVLKMCHLSWCLHYRCCTSWVSRLPEWHRWRAMKCKLFSALLQSRAQLSYVPKLTNVKAVLHTHPFWAQPINLGQREGPHSNLWHAVCVAALEGCDISGQRLHWQDPGGGPQRTLDSIQSHQPPMAGLGGLLGFTEEPPPHHLPQPAAAPVHTRQQHKVCKIYQE